MRLYVINGSGTYAKKFRNFSRACQYAKKLARNGYATFVIPASNTEVNLASFLPR